MERKQYKGTIDEWYLAKLYFYMQFGDGEYIKKIHKHTKTLYTLIVIALLSLFIGMNMNIPKIYETKFYGGVVLLFILIVMTVILKSDVKAKYKDAQPPSNSQQDITLYEITDIGLKVNIYNTGHYETIYWNEVNYVRPTETVYKERHINGLREDNGTRNTRGYEYKKELRTIKKEYPTFTGDYGLETGEIDSLVMVRKDNKINKIVIPHTWSEDKKEEFVEEIKKQTRYIKNEYIANVIRETIPKKYLKVARRIDKVDKFLEGDREIKD